LHEGEANTLVVALHSTSDFVYETEAENPSAPTFPKSLSNALHTLADRENTSFFTTILAGFATLLARYSSQQEFVIGTVTSGRKRSEFETLLGCFQNPLALRLKFAGDPSFGEFLGHAREVTLGALSHDDAPFDRLVKELSVRRDTSRSPVFPVMFSLVPPRAAVEAGWDLSQLDLDIGTAKFDFDLEFDDRPEGLLGRFVYSTDLFDRDRIERMAHDAARRVFGARVKICREQARCRRRDDGFRLCRPRCFLMQRQLQVFTLWRALLYEVGIGDAFLDSRNEAQSFLRCTLRQAHSFECRPCVGDVRPKLLLGARRRIPRYHVKSMR